MFNIVIQNFSIFKKNYVGSYDRAERKLKTKLKNQKVNLFKSHDILQSF
jgi:hypothetical protein